MTAKPLLFIADSAGMVIRGAVIWEIGAKMSSALSATPCTSSDYGAPVGAAWVARSAAENARRFQGAGRDRPTAVAFWATYCAPCRAEVPALNDAQRWRDRGLPVLGVALETDAERVRRCATHLGHTLRRRNHRRRPGRAHGPALPARTSHDSVRRARHGDARRTVPRRRGARTPRPAPARARQAGSVTTVISAANSSRGGASRYATPRRRSLRRGDAIRRKRGDNGTSGVLICPRVQTDDPIRLGCHEPGLVLAGSGDVQAGGERASSSSWTMAAGFQSAFDHVARCCLPVCMVGAVDAVHGAGGVVRGGFGPNALAVSRCGRFVRAISRWRASSLRPWSA
jgi:hypothetical protein